MSTLNTQAKIEPKKPHVLIVGAGLGGILFAILLDRQGVTYEIFERSSEARPLGSVMCMNANILPAFEQLGMLDELMADSLPTNQFHIVNSKMEYIAKFNETNVPETVGYEFRLFTRRRLYQILCSHVSPEKIHYSKKVTEVTQDDKSASLTCNDGTTYSGDIIVGADGTYSGVRKSLYEQLQKDKLLPVSDTKSMNKGYVCLVGITNSLDPTKYPDAAHESAVLTQVVGDKSRYSWSIVNVPGNRFSWDVVLQLESGGKDDINNAEWSAATNETMINEIKDFKVPVGGTLGELINDTPKDGISRVYLEDKIFDTWHHKRVVLLGDACHKLLPSSGQGAINAMQDAVILANCVYDLESLSINDIDVALKDYKNQRYPHALEQYNASNASGAIVFGHKWYQRLLRYVLLNYLPKSIQNKNQMKNLEYQPRITYLPSIPKRGINRITPQKPSTRNAAGLVFRWDATNDLRIGNNLDIVVGPNSMLLADCFMRPARLPLPPPGQSTNNTGLAYPTVVTEVAVSQSLSGVTAKVLHYFSARTTIRAYLVIKIWGPRQDGTIAMVALLYRRANPNPMIPISIVSFGTAGIDPQAHQILVGIVGNPNFITGVGYDGVPCDSAGIPTYQLNIPVVDIFHGDPQGIPAARIHGFNLDLWDIQEQVQAVSVAMNRNV
ncbi:hypothetical protein BGZ76_008663 [Entomortierella beljakovae]|nr:hypothetical protein BGZ76_008663 [Entomortierella beljakovae]